jgi:hypothetical protein
VIDRALWIMLRAAFVECTFREVVDRAYAPSPQRDGPGEVVADEDIERARSLFEDGFRRREAVGAKVSALLTMAGVVIPLTVALTSVIPKPWFAALALIPQMWSALLLVSCLGVERASTLSYTPTSGNAGDDRRALVKDYLTAASINEGAVNFIVDAYRAALRSFVVASLVLVTVAAASAASRDKQGDPVESLIARIKLDKVLAAELRGPAGDRGPPGPQGAQGAGCTWLPPVSASPTTP